MDTQQIYNILDEVFQDVFDDESLHVTSATKAEDVAGWDSMNHINLIISTEARLGIKFKTAEIEGLRNVGHLADVISKHLNGK